MSWYKKAQGKITLVNYDDGELTVLKDGALLRYEGVDRDSVDKLIQLITWWRYGKAYELLSQFRMI